jgi:glycogen debranching enzyme
MQAISGYPEFAAGALRRLGALQATGNDPERDMEPGKIPHEVRHGELAQLGILPYQPYYGTHDATSLYIIVLSYLYQWLGDESILRRYLPNAEAALAWIDHFGDRDRDGLQEYATRSSHGYYNQGWKDAGDAIPNADGTLAALPIALCELQGYVYDAKLRMGDIYEILGRPKDARRLRREARALFDRVNERLWWEEEGTYALGLDGSKRQIQTVASNAGHLLQSGIVPPERAGSVVRRLMAEDMWSGWGVRTLSSDHPAYNPFSYQTGSVWPHDNAMIISGLRAYGRDAEALTLASALFDAAAGFRDYRLPELFCGYARDPGGEPPVSYPVACSPQAWAAGAMPDVITSLLGLRADACARTVRVDPVLPPWIDWIELDGLRLGTGTVDLRVERRSDGTIRHRSRSEQISVVRGDGEHSGAR